MENSIGLYGSLSSRLQDSPLDVRERVNSVEDITNIENPYVGMMVFVISENAYYKITELKSEGGSIIKKAKTWIPLINCATTDDINGMF